MRKLDKDAASAYLMLHFGYISPIQAILNNLENDVYKDSDLEYLNQKLHNFTTVAAKGLGVYVKLGDGVVAPFAVDSNTLNQYNKETLKRYFNILLDYFTSLAEDLL